MLVDWTCIRLACNATVTHHTTSLIVQPFLCHSALGHAQGGTGKANKGTVAMKAMKKVKAKAGGKPMMKAKSTKDPKGAPKIRKVLKKPAGKASNEGTEEPMDADGVPQGVEEEEAEQTESGKGATANDFRRFNVALGTAPKHVIEKVQQIKSMHVRSGKRAQLAQMVMAFAEKKWDHKMFTATEELTSSNSTAKEQKAMPKFLMMAKYGGAEMFKAALMANEVEEVENPEGGAPLYRVVTYKAFQHVFLNCIAACMPQSLANGGHSWGIHSH